MSGLAEPKAFAERWVAAWNARDLDTMMSFFAEDVVFSSPLAAKLVPDSGGLIRGKEALRDYWSTALARADALHFELTTLYAGVDVLLVGFRTHEGVERCEVLRFRGGLVFEGHGTYGIG